MPADLSITMDDGVTAVAPGAATSYTIVVSNNGPDAVTGATVFGSPPFDTTADTWLATGSTGGGSVTGTIASNATGTITNTVTVAPPAGTTDTNSANDTATDNDTIPAADLAVTMTDGTTTVVPGTSNTYTITVTNNGPDTVTSLTLTDTIPAALLNPNFAPSVGAYDTNTGVWS